VPSQCSYSNSRGCAFHLPSFSAQSISVLVS
jgi:hypothetical protein